MDVFKFLRRCGINKSTWATARLISLLEFRNIIPWRSDLWEVCTTYFRAHYILSHECELLQLAPVESAVLVGLQTPLYLGLYFYYLSVHVRMTPSDRLLHSKQKVFELVSCHDLIKENIYLCILNCTFLWLLQVNTFMHVLDSHTWHLFPELP